MNKFYVDYAIGLFMGKDEFCLLPQSTHEYET